MWMEPARRRRNGNEIEIADAAFISFNTESTSDVRWTTTTQSATQYCEQSTAEVYLSFAGARKLHVEHYFH